ncbi:prenyltransferase [Alkalibacillus salilacus]|uniref:1,4-dihydroxy-2-naphthoate octaprenyltransferase n=1 Tax=Alkalibacillus salilacus TaxID=284582 RepID=A0ABT9VBC9_9BACI|nr:prenyltransferase [Alkalibacillus salilacus]MDQ0158271.1 1,4-dihydroxy-2-naphthoate octaprenyltransferase [Alkalibacillus salilacus]
MVQAVYLYRRHWFGLFRPMTLIASIAPLTVATYAATEGDFSILLLWVLLVIGLLIQGSMNMLNDYFDFKKGQDVDRWKVCHKRPLLGPSLEQIPFVALALTTLAISLTLVIADHHYGLIASLGLLGLLIGFFYSATNRSLAAIGLGEIAGSISLGLLPVSIAFALYVDQFTMDAVFIAIPFMLLMATMVMANNIRDIEKDAGYRMTIPMQLGRYTSAWVYLTILIMLYMYMPLMAVLNVFPTVSLLIFIALPVALRLIKNLLTANQFKTIQAMKLAAYHYWAFAMAWMIALIWNY